MTFATQHVINVPKVYSSAADPEPAARSVHPVMRWFLEILGVEVKTVFGQRFERGLRIVISTIWGVGIGLLAFALGVPEVVGLCIGTAVAGLIFALLKDFDQGPTAV